SSDCLSDISFPTRRSSDLLTLHGKFVTPTTMDYEVDDTVVSFEGLNDALQYQYYIKNDEILDEPFTETFTNYIDLKPFESLFLKDRKSTRLNSSHVKISYA